MTKRTMRAGIVLGCVACLPLAPGALAGNGYDGTYSGQVTLVRGTTSFCGKSPLPVSKQIVNGHFDLVFDLEHHVGVNLEVQPDGSFSGSQQYMYVSRLLQVTASGKITGNVLRAHIEGQACARDYNLTKG